MTRPQLWLRARPAALAIARDTTVRGLEPDDVRQEALLALWVASGAFDAARGPWLPFARLVVQRRMWDLMHRASVRLLAFEELELDEERDAAPDRPPASVVLAPLFDALPLLTGRERAAVAAHLNGARADDNALWRARRKLRAAA